MGAFALHMVFSANFSLSQSPVMREGKGSLLPKEAREGRARNPTPARGIQLAFCFLLGGVGPARA